MCGIAGLLHKKRNVTERDLNLMTDRLVHRGPDGVGYFIQDQIGIAHRRLSIIDLDGGKQPLSNEDASIWITFNGEIYNYRDLRQQLIQKGHVFRTQSDTEVVVHGYEEWGFECVSHFRGMFAFAIVDTRTKELFLARDHFGIKPLVYGESDSVFCFASEIQSLRTVQEMSFSHNLEAINQYLQFLYIPAPATVYQNIYKLPPAHYMRVNFEGRIIDRKCYWQFEFKQGVSKSKKEWEEELVNVLKESVKVHLVSDVPFGAFLSGGIDSSIVTAFMAQQMSQPVKTFSIGFKEQKYNELGYARTVAERWHTEHYEEIVEPDALSILPDLVKHYGEPFGDSSAIPTWYVSRLARNHVAMVLTGDAGDELFAGYESYTSRWSRHIQPVPEHLNPFKKFLYPFLNRIIPSRFPLRTSELKDWLKYIQYYTDDMRGQLWKKEKWYELKKSTLSFFEHVADQISTYSHFQKAQALDFNTYLPNDILAKVDIASMMHGLETRTPLLDLRVAEIASTIPEEYNILKKNGVWNGKLMLKSILEKYHTKEFVYRPKMGFSIPLEYWFGKDGANAKEVRERLLDPGNGLDSLFNKSVLIQIYNSNYTGQKWQLLFLQEWLHQNT